MSSKGDWEGLEPIAIVGMGCRMPGDVRSPGDLWKLIMSKAIANTDRVPKSRFNIDAYLHPSSDRPGSFNVPGGYFLNDDPEAFDTGMFGMSHVEALSMDPQQRKLLEVVFETFESSGTTLETIASRKTGCYVGNFTQDFLHMATKEQDFRSLYTAIGVDGGMLANRISHLYDLRGPSLTINTACSSTMYALHLACQALRAGDCDGAIVGGSQLILTVDQQMNTARMGVLSPTNQCHTFCEMADGYGRSEGVGALYLRPLSLAIRDGDPIRAVVRASATGSSGKSEEAIVHPSIEGQTDVIVSAYRSANLEPDETAYIECHGTGTQIGDPIEVNAVHKAMNHFGRRSSSILVGSLKPNVGHSEASSSIGTIIKTVLALENGIIPPTAGIRNLNPRIQWDDLNVQVVSEPTAWPASHSTVRRIGINAFGYGGTNSHALIESSESFTSRSYNLVHPHGSGPPTAQAQSFGDSEEVHNSREAVISRPHLLIFSAHDEPTLQNMLVDYSKLPCKTQQQLADICFTLANHRTKFPTRAVAIVRQNSLESDILVASEDIYSMRTGYRIQPAFVFTGQGAQWAHMGISLLYMYPRLVRQTIRNLDRYLQLIDPPPSWTIETILQQPSKTSVINEAEYSQPLCTAIQITLVDLLRHWGVTPLATVGHSSGRISAAHAITAAYFRGRIANSVQADGAMLAVSLGADDVSKRYLQLPESPWFGRVVVACHNSPQSATLSGDADAIESLATILQRDSILTRTIRTGGKAYHSHHMTGPAAEYAHILSSSPSCSSAPGSTCDKLPIAAMYSTVEAAELSHDDELTDTYWAKNLSSPVLFEEAVELMLTARPDINLLIEIGPHPALAGPLRQILQAHNKGDDVAYLPTLKRNEHAGTSMLKLAGSIWARDGPIDMQAITGILETSHSEGVNLHSDDTRGELEAYVPSFVVDLPPYHWTYSVPCWLENRTSREQRQLSQPRHDILGRRVPGLSALEPTWRNILRQKDLPWLCDHRLGGEVMLPGTGYLALAFEAITQINEEVVEPVTIESYTIRDVAFLSATVVPDDDAGTETIFRMRAMDKNSSGSLWYEFFSSCCSYGTWKETSRGKIGINAISSRHLRNLSMPPEPKSAPSWRKTKHIDWLNKLRTVGFDQGPAFQHIDDIEYAPHEFAARADMPITTTITSCSSPGPNIRGGESRYVLHPTVLDATLQPSLATIHGGDPDALRCGTIPTHIHEATLVVPSALQLAHTCKLQVWTPAPFGNRAFTTRVRLTADDGTALLDLSGRHVFYRSAIPHELRGPANQDLYLREEFKVDADYHSPHGARCHPSACGCLSSPAAFSFCSLLDVLIHKRPALRILCIEETLLSVVLAARPWIHVTAGAVSQKSKDELESQFMGRDQRLSVVVLDIYSSAMWQDGALEESTDLLILSSPSISSGEGLWEVFHRLFSMLAFEGHLFIEGESPASTVDLMVSAGFSRQSIQKMPDGSISALKREASVTVTTGKESRSVLLIHPSTCGDAASPIFDATRNVLEVAGWKVIVKTFTDLSTMTTSATTDEAPPERVVILDDQIAEGPLLANLDDERLRGVTFLTESATCITWVTCGGLLRGDRPEYAMVRGAARSIRIEKVFRLDLVTLDYDGEHSSRSTVPGLVADILQRQATNSQNGETEYYIQDGVVHIGRVMPHYRLNENFVTDSGHVKVISMREEPEIAVHGVLDEATGGLGYHRDHNDQDRGEPGLGDGALKSDEVIVNVEAIGLTELDGADDSGVLSHQFAGVVVAAGPDARRLFTEGSAVAGFASHFQGRLATFQRTTSSLLFTLPDGCEDDDDDDDDDSRGCKRMIAGSTMPSSFATAIYTLEELARIEPGDTVVVLDGLGAAGLACIQLCRILRAHVLVITSSQSTHDLLVDSDFIGPHCKAMLWDHKRNGSSQNQSLRDLLHENVDGSIDALVCPASLPADTSVLENIGPWLSSCARVVAVGSTIGKTGLSNRDILLSALSVTRAFHFFQFELRDVAELRPRVMARIVERCGLLYREGSIKPIHPVTTITPENVFDSVVPADIGLGMNVVSYARNSTFFQVVSPSLTRAHVEFKVDATYLLVGCLGGIGSTVARWMADKGAKHMAFLSRSGTDNNPAAAATVEALRERGVVVVVLRANVMNYGQVVRAMDELRGWQPRLPPLRGVLNAAGVIRDRVLSNMTVAAWEQVSQPKVQGSLNLHKALLSPAGEQQQPLDFFVMTSSVTAVCGSAGQANYTAANAVMDSLACHRRARKLPAVSLVLTAIHGMGWFSRNPELERMLRAKGIYGILEQEMLDAFALAMMPQHEDDGIVEDHIIVGFQPRRAEAAIRESGVDAHWFQSPRFGWLRTAMDEHRSKFHSGVDQSHTNTADGRRLDIVRAVRQAVDRDVAVAAVQKHLAARLARLLMLDETKMSMTHRSMASHGLDSMIGTELRNWLFKEFGVDMPFQQLLSSSLTISELAAFLCDKVLATGTEGV